MLKWTRSFLSNRRQQVSVNVCKSTWMDVVSGVPQGSVLGPVLFLMYLNDLLQLDNVQSNIKLFADDTKLFRRIRGPDDCHALQKDITVLEEWSSQWLLKFHPDKCKVMRLGCGHPATKYFMTNSDGQPVTLEETPEEKDLGVTIDNKLRFNKHIQQAAAKANRIVGLLRRSFTTLDCKSFPLLFRSLVRPLLEYGNMVWSPRFRKT